MNTETVSQLTLNLLGPTTVGDRINPQVTNVIYIYGAHILDVSRSHTTTQHSRQDSSGRVISSSQRPLPDNTTDKYPCSRWDSNPRSQQVSGLLRSWVRILPRAWIFVCCECRVLSGSLCDELITRPEESYRLWFVVVCDLETSRICAPYIYIYIYIYMTLVA